MNTITSESLDQCLEYCDITQLSATNYGTFIRSLVYTMKAELPVEIMDHETNQVIKGQITSFSIDYTEGKEGVTDRLSIQYVVEGETEGRTLAFEKIGRLDVTQDRKSSARSFYRYYINQNKDRRYRITFNRRISKVQ